MVTKLQVFIYYFYYSLCASSPGATFAETVVITGSSSSSNLNVGKIIVVKKAPDAKKWHLLAMISNQ